MTDRALAGRGLVSHCICSSHHTTSVSVPPHGRPHRLPRPRILPPPKVDTLRRSTPPSRTGQGQESGGWCGGEKGGERGRIRQEQTNMLLILRESARKRCSADRSEQNGRLPPPCRYTGSNSGTRKRGGGWQLAFGLGLELRESERKHQPHRHQPRPSSHSGVMESRRFCVTIPSTNEIKRFCFQTKVTLPKP